MATMIKRNARKLSTIGPIDSIGYGNFQYPGLLESKHISFTLGEYKIRLSKEEAKELRTGIGKVLKEYFDESD